MGELAIGELSRDVKELGKVTAGLTEALRGHVEFCTEDRQREAETRKRLERQFEQMMQQLGEVDSRRRSGIERLHQRQDEEAERRAAAIAAVNADSARWRQRLLWSVLVCSGTLIAFLGSALYMLAQRFIYISPPHP